MSVRAGEDGLRNSRKPTIETVTINETMESEGKGKFGGRARAASILSKKKK